MSEWATVPLAKLREIRFSNVDKKVTPREVSVRLSQLHGCLRQRLHHRDLPLWKLPRRPMEIESVSQWRRVMSLLPRF